MSLIAWNNGKTDTKELFSLKFNWKIAERCINELFIAFYQVFLLVHESLSMKPDDDDPEKEKQKLFKLSSFIGKLKNRKTKSLAKNLKIFLLIVD